MPINRACSGRPSTCSICRGRGCRRGAGGGKGGGKGPLPVSSFEGTNVYSLAPAEGGGDAVLLDGDGAARYRYEPIAVGGGTLLVQYGFTDIKGSNAFVRSFV